jgi:hypothetical protein
MRVGQFFASDIVLAGQHFRKNKAYFIPGSKDSAFDGLLGVRAFGFRAVSYDHTKRTLYLQK